MGRKNIFEILAKDFDLNREMSRIQKLLAYDVIDDYYSDRRKLFDFCDAYCFSSWKQRHRCINCTDLANTLGIPNELKSSMTVDKMLRILEFYTNIILIAYKCSLERKAVRLKEFDLLLNNIKEIIDRLNHQISYDGQEERAIIVEKDAAATAVAEIVEPDLAKQVIEYNHHLMKGDLPRKKKILIALGEKLEAMRKDIPSALVDDIFFMLNNLNVRHNNVDFGSKSHKGYTAGMSAAVLEEWYDELYQTALLALLSVDHKERATKINELKSHY